MHRMKILVFTKDMFETADEILVFHSRAFGWFAKGVIYVLFIVFVCFWVPMAFTAEAIELFTGKRLPITHRHYEEGNEIAVMEMDYRRRHTERRLAKRGAA